MDFQTAVKTVLSKYAHFQGRAIRSEYWFWILFCIIGNAIFRLLDSVLFANMQGQPISWLFALATLLPTIAVAARRLHDQDRSGWWLLLAMIPLIGQLIVIYWLIQPGTDGPNQFGEKTTT